MTNTVRITIMTGLILIFLGIFLPWKIQGDIATIYTYGIQIYPKIEDNGGLFILLLMILIYIFVFRPPKNLQMPFSLLIIFNILIIIDSIYFIIKYTIQHITSRGSTAAPSVDIGLIMVAVGSLILLLSLFINHNKKYV